MKRPKFLMQLLPIALSCVLFVACDKDDDMPEEGPVASVSVTHAAPGAPPVDILVDNNRVTTTSKLAFGSTTGTPGSPYLQLNSGNRNVKVTADGTNFVFDGNVTLQPNMNYSLFAYDTVMNGQIKVLALQDDLSAPAANNVKVRFLHLSPNAPPVDVLLINGTDTVALEDQTYIGASPNAAELSGFAAIPTAAYRVVVRAGDATVLDIPSLPLANGKIYTVYAKGLAGATGDLALGAGVVQHN